MLIQLLIMYILTGVLWTSYAIRKQTHLSTSILKLIICIILNFLCWPIAIIIATYKNS